MTQPIKWEYNLIPTVAQYAVGSMLTTLSHSDWRLAQVGEYINNPLTFWILVRRPIQNIESDSPLDMV